MGCSEGWILRVWVSKWQPDALQAKDSFVIILTRKLTQKQASMTQPACLTHTNMIITGVMPCMISLELASIFWSCSFPRRCHRRRVPLSFHPVPIVLSTQHATPHLIPMHLLPRAHACVHPSIVPLRGPQCVFLQTCIKGSEDSCHIWGDLFRLEGRTTSTPTLISVKLTQRFCSGGLWFNTHLRRVRKLPLSNLLM